jgi:hypothetical protein
MAEGRETKGADLVRFIVAENGYHEVSERLQDDLTTKALVAWPKGKAGRPNKDEPREPKWEVLVEALEASGAYPHVSDDSPEELRRKRVEGLRKDWEAFVRERPPQR